MDKTSDIKKLKKIITYGTYDMLHIGHINLLTRAKARGDYLIVGVTSDDYDRSRGKLNIIQSQEKRMAVIKALNIVDEVILETNKEQKKEDIIKYHIDEFVIGNDWVGKFDYLNKYTKVIYLPRTEGVSSTKLRNENTKVIKIGIVGANSDSHRFLSEMHHVGFIKAPILYDSNPTDIKQIASRFDFRQTFQDYDLFLKQDIDAVYISTSISEHYNDIKMALNANKHVLCENPLVTKPKHAEELFKLAKEKNLLLLMALKTAFAPAFNKMLEEVKHGAIGQVKEVRATFTSLYRERGFPKRYTKNGATNLLMNYPSLLVHKIAGESKNIMFFDQHNGEYDIANRAITTHKNNIIGISTVGIEMKSDGNAVISGTKGYIYIPAPWWLTKEFFVHFEDPSKEYKFEYEFDGDGLRYMISEFTSLIRQGKIESDRLGIDDMLELSKIVTNYNQQKTG